MSATMNRKSVFCKAAAAVCAVSALMAFNCFAVLAAPPEAMTADTVAMASVKVKEVTSPHLEPSVKTALNAFLKTYGNTSPDYRIENRPYAVFDFDNTTSVMDVEEQLMIWQLDHLAFAVAPEKMEDVLKTGIPAAKLDLTYGADDGSGKKVSIRSAIADAAKAYGELYAGGYVSVAGREQPASVRRSGSYQEFAAKMRWLYDAIGETMDASVSYPWVTYWFTGMTPEQVHALAYQCDSYYGDPAKGQTWTKGAYASPKDYVSAAGPVTVSFKQGITVTPEIRELYAALDANGIDTWINSASPLDVVRAAVDYFRIPGVDGIVAMTNKKDEQGRYINAYDYDLHAQTQGVGKAETIDSVIRPLYHGRGPAFAAMDSQGDFNFCTEYKDTKLVLVLNRKRSDDAALCAAAALWQKEKGIGLVAAGEQGDTLYVLQGRNENTGSLWATEETRLLGKKENAGLSDKGKAALQELRQGKSIRDMLHDKTKLSAYGGYKSR
ncbi:haloacid dehalogenase-like hydrolase [Megasphaera vaginalis (ex Bordigoni et al. 2020)]|uniref:haloacid dehalogenase-like hydrolase n=2 Tax=Megasphaera TaxID=906 RepID=UPI000C7C1892|nr:haloacid dehalogenase-like hydrolase [Megasphaera vaginalis (ex Bordigoni et al. 2020)]